MDERAGPLMKAGFGRRTGAGIPWAAAVPALGLPAAEADDHPVARWRRGTTGGRLVVPPRAEPRMLKPVDALDTGSREAISLIMGSRVDIGQDRLGNLRVSVPRPYVLWNADVRYLARPGNHE